MIDMESRTACFTGHRELPTDDLPEISKRLKDTHSSSTITRLFNLNSTQNYPIQSGVGIASPS